VHHSEILMQQDVAVEDECAGDGRIAEIHSYFHAGIRPGPRPVGDFDGVTKILVGNGFSVDFQHHEVDLVDVKVVRFEGVVFNGPVFYRTDFRGNRWLLVGLENLLLLSVDRDVELNGTVGSAKLPEK